MSGVCAGQHPNGYNLITLLPSLTAAFFQFSELRHMSHRIGQASHVQYLNFYYNLSHFKYQVSHFTQFKICGFFCKISKGDGMMQAAEITLDNAERYRDLGMRLPIIVNARA